MMWKQSCPVVNIHEKYPVENIMKTQLKTLNGIEEKRKEKTSSWSQLNWYHPNLQLNWYVHNSSNSINPIMTGSTRNWSISRVFPVEQLSSNPSWTSWTSWTAWVQLECSIFCDGNLFRPVELVSNETSSTGINWNFDLGLVLTRIQNQMVCSW